MLFGVDWLLAPKAVTDVDFAAILTLGPMNKRVSIIFGVEGCRE